MKDFFRELIQELPMAGFSPKAQIAAAGTGKGFKGASMKRKLVFLFAVLPLITACIASGQKGAPSERYIIVDVGTLGGTFSAAHGLNDRGWAAGIGTLPGDASVRAFERRNGRLIDLGTLGGPNSDVGFTPFENDGVIAGDAEVPEADPTGADFCLHGTQLICLPVVWHHDRIEVLPTLGGNNGSLIRSTAMDKLPEWLKTRNLDRLASPPATFFSSSQCYTIRRAFKS